MVLKFDKVSDLIEYLKQFNPEAKVLTDMSFSWSKIGSLGQDDKLTTDILYVYGDYTPYYTEEEEYYRLRDYILEELSEKYNIVDCSIGFEDSIATYYIRFKGFLPFNKRKRIHKSIIGDVMSYCDRYGLDMEYVSLLYVPENHF